MLFLRSLLRVRLIGVPTSPIYANNRCNYCPDEGCQFVSIAANYNYRLFPVGENNVILENWNYVLDRSVNVTTIIVQNNGKRVVCGLKRYDAVQCSTRKTVLDRASRSDRPL